MATIYSSVSGFASGSDGSWTSIIRVKYTYTVSNSDTATTVSVNSIASEGYTGSGSNIGYRAKANAKALSALKSTTFKLIVDGTTIATQSGISNVNTTVSKSGSKSITKTHSAQSKTVNFNGNTATVSVPAKTSYAVTFNANSGSGAPANQTKWYNETLTLTTNAPVKNGYVFRGWATSAENAAICETISTYTANAPITLYAAWELDYKKPTISNLHVERCNASGVNDDDGTYAKVTFDWTVFRSANARYYDGDTYPYRDNTIYEGIVTVGTISKTFTSSAASGSETVIVGNGSFSPDLQYDAEVSITDSQDIVASHTTTLAGILATSYFPMDFNRTGTAMGIFMPAPDNDEGVYLGKDLFLPIDTTEPPDTTTTDGQIYQALKDLGWDSDVIV